MFFNFVRPKIVVDAFTHIESIEKVTPIVQASQYVPEWWKSLPKRCPYGNTSVEGLERATMRSCPAVMELFATGLIIPLWADLAIQTTDEGACNWQWAGSIDINSSGIICHDRAQYGPAFSTYHQLKILSPWYLSDKTGTKFLFINSFWNQLDILNSFHVCHGMVSYTVMPETHINMLVDSKKINTIIPHKTPMVQLIPMTDKHVVVKTHVLTKEALDKKFSMPAFRHAFYNNLIKTMRG